jgi:hypothetical protein
MKNRPTSVTVIAWFIIVMAGMSAILAIANKSMVRDLLWSNSPIPVPVQCAMGCIGLLISIVSGIAMLRGCNWARFLYVIWNAIDYVGGVAISIEKQTWIPSLLVFVVISVYLFRPKAAEYFLPSEPAQASPGRA